MPSTAYLATRLLVSRGWL